MASSFDGLEYECVFDYRDGPNPNSVGNLQTYTFDRVSGKLAPSAASAKNFGICAGMCALWLANMRTKSPAESAPDSFRASLLFTKAWGKSGAGVSVNNLQGVGFRVLSEKRRSSFHRAAHEAAIQNGAFMFTTWDDSPHATASWLPPGSVGYYYDPNIGMYKVARKHLVKFILAFQEFTGHDESKPAMLYSVAAG